MADAHELSISDNPLQVEREFEQLVTELEKDSCPKTYLAVLGVLLVARSMFEASELDVLEIKAGGSSLGYSAPSIGKELAVFAKDQSIDLRATSTQPLNNQPFTYKNRIESNITVRSSSKGFWDSFYASASRVNGLKSDDAFTALAWLFRRRKAVKSIPKAYLANSLERQNLWECADKLSKFVNDFSDSGRVGQAFASACFDVLYGSQFVLQGNAQDPDAAQVGDVHVISLESVTPWLWVEVKQQVVQTGAVKGFLEKVNSSGGRRVVYLALKNSSYSSNIDVGRIQEFAARQNMQLLLFKSPEDFLSYVLEISPGSFGQQLEHLLEAFDVRLVEAGASSVTLESFRAVVQSFANAE